MNTATTTTTSPMSPETIPGPGDSGAGAPHGRAASNVTSSETTPTAYSPQQKPSSRSRSRHRPTANAASTATSITTNGRKPKEPTKTGSPGATPTAAPSART